MSILDDLKALQQKYAKLDPQQPTDGMSYISAAVTHSALYRAGVDDQVIKDVLLEPVESREAWISYFETVGRKK